jgi:hypothetical protein
MVPNARMYGIGQGGNHTMMRINKHVWLGVAVFMLASAQPAGALDQRDMVGHLRGPYNLAFFYRHNAAFRISAAIHIAHAVQHDILQLSQFSDHAATDMETDAEFLQTTFNPPRTEPTMEMFGPYTGRFIFDLYRAIDWTHMHHEQTYDILSDKNIPWSEKQQWTDRAVSYYLEKFDIPRSPAPLDVTMRRAGVMMKPYFSLFRNYYPDSNNFFYAAHWWHPVIYEAIMLGGNDDEQVTMVQQTDSTYYSQVLKKRPLRMLLSREVMPRYSRFSPESANIFDNLHMLHGIAYDILAYPEWTPGEKAAELKRVIEAMSYQPGDEKLARKFNIPYPEMDPRVYVDWMQGTEGDMNRIMMEMMEEMMPIMMPGGMHDEMKARMMEQVRMKLAPGMQQGEIPGSLHQAMQKMMPHMQMMPEAMHPGATPQKMIDAMLAGWQAKWGGMPDAEPWPMTIEPEMPTFPEEIRQAGWLSMDVQNKSKFKP